MQLSFRVVHATFRDLVIFCYLSIADVRILSELASDQFQLPGCQHTWFGIRMFAVLHPAFILKTFDNLIDCSLRNSFLGEMFDGGWSIQILPLEKIDDEASVLLNCARSACVPPSGADVFSRCLLFSVPDESAFLIGSRCFPFQVEQEQISLFFQLFLVQTSNSSLWQCSVF